MSAPVQHSRHGGMPRRKVGVPQPLSTTAYGTPLTVSLTIRPSVMWSLPEFAGGRDCAGRPLPSGGRGRRFKSSHSDHRKPCKISYLNGRPEARADRILASRKPHGRTATGFGHKATALGALPPALARTSLVRARARITGPDRVSNASHPRSRVQAQNHGPGPVPGYARGACPPIRGYGTQVARGSLGTIFGWEMKGLGESKGATGYLRYRRPPKGAKIENPTSLISKAYKGPHANFRGSEVPPETPEKPPRNGPNIP